MKPTIIVAFLGFVVLGLPEGILGLAWPSIRDEFDLSQGAVGAYLLAMTTGFLITTFNSGTIVRRLGIGMALLLAFLLRGIAFGLIFLVPSYQVVIVLALSAGLASGVIDAGLNTYVSGFRSTRLMNWLHACFGLGATISPLLMTALFSLDLDWRWGYLAIGLAQFSIVIGLVTTLTHWRQPILETDSTIKPATTAETLRLPLVWIGIAVFALYAGLEVSAGQWSFSLFTESRGIDASLAGFWVSIYWGSFTFGRFVFGVIGDRFSMINQVRGCIVGALAGAALIWWSPIEWANAAGLTVLGFSLASIFPVLIAATPGRVGDHHAPNVIGFQVGAAGLGIAILPSLAGVLAETFSVSSPLLVLHGGLDLTGLFYDKGLEIVGPFLLAASAALLILHEVLVRMARQPETAAAPVPQ